MVPPHARSRLRSRLPPAVTCMHAIGASRGAIPAWLIWRRTRHAPLLPQAPSRAVAMEGYRPRHRSPGPPCRSRSSPAALAAAGRGARLDPHFASPVAARRTRAGGGDGAHAPVDPLRAAVRLRRPSRRAQGPRGGDADRGRFVVAGAFFAVLWGRPSCPCAPDPREVLGLTVVGLSPSRLAGRRSLALPSWMKLIVQALCGWTFNASASRRQSVDPLTGGSLDLRGWGVCSTSCGRWRSPTRST